MTKRLSCLAAMLMILLYYSVAAAATVDELPQETSLSQIWQVQKITHLQKGEISVPDTIINKFFTRQLTTNSTIKEVKLTAKDENRVSIQITTMQGNEFFLEGTFQEFYHDKDKSYFKFKVQKKSLADKSLTSWLFSHLGLGFITTIFGSVDAPEGVTVKIRGNGITVDFHDALRANAATLGTIRGIPISDAVKIHEITSTAGSIHIRTSVDMKYVAQTLFGH